MLKPVLTRNERLHGLKHTALTSQPQRPPSHIYSNMQTDTYITNIYTQTHTNSQMHTNPYTMSYAHIGLYTAT